MKFTDKDLFSLSALTDGQYVEEALEAPAGHRRRVLPALLLAAALAALLTLCVFAADAISYSTYYLSLYDDPASAELLDRSTAAARARGRAQYEAKELDIRAVAVTGDEHSAMIWFDLVLPDELADRCGEGELIWFDESPVRTLFGDRIGRIGFSPLSVRRKAGNVYSFCVSIEEVTEIVRGRTVRVRLGDLYHYDPATDYGIRKTDTTVLPDYPLLCAGQADFIIRLSYPDLTLRYAPDVTGRSIDAADSERSRRMMEVAQENDTFDRVSFVLHPERLTVEISPLNVYIEAWTPEKQSDYFYFPDVTLVFSDGTELTCTPGSHSGRYVNGEGETDASRASLTEPIDPENVAAVRVGKTEFRLK